jgi:NAD-dependent dihydropyrimidine dehydrogenase PreA subunit
MSAGKAFVVLAPEAFEPVSFDAELCIGCNICVDVCQVDIMIPNPGVGLPPVLVFPGECWYDGSCVDSCPVPGAMFLNRMSRNSVHVRRKTTGADFHI